MDNKPSALYPVPCPLYPMQDHYETLQVHPRADPDAIRAAYERLRQRYDPAKLEDAADELQALARRRRDEIERAFTLLGDPERRRAYDLELAERGAPVARQAAVADSDAPPDELLIDYRPLPPARRQERPAGFNAQPVLPPSRASRSMGRNAGRSAVPIWVAPALIVAAATFAIVLVTLITTVLNAPAPVATGGPQILDPNAPTAAPTPNVAEVINQFEAQITAARQVAEQVPDNPNAWTELGNALYNSLVVVRERLTSSDQSLQSVYIERLPRWLEAADAYRKASELRPQDPVARADLAASLCYYGQGINDPSFVQQGIVEAQRAVQLGPDEGRVLISNGLCLALSDPPRQQQALEQWQRLVVQPNADPGLVFQARQLIAEYSQ